MRPVVTWEHALLPDGWIVMGMFPNPQYYWTRSAACSEGAGKTYRHPALRKYFRNREVVEYYDWLTLEEERYRRYELYQ